MDGERSSTEPTEVELQTGVGVSAALVAGLVVVHLAMAYAVSTLPDLVRDLVEPISNATVADLVVDVMVVLPLALVVLGVARTVLRGAAACVVVIVSVLLAHVTDSVWWATDLLVLGAALAWGIARRYGLWWLGGVLVAPLVATLVRWIDPDPFADDVALWASFRALVLHVVPVVLAGLAGWALEWEEDRRA